MFINVAKEAKRKLLKSVFNMNMIQAGFVPFRDFAGLVAFRSDKSIIAAKVVRVLLEYSQYYLFIDKYNDVLDLIIENNNKFSNI